MKNLRQHEDDIIDVIVTGQAFSDAILTISDKFFYKHLLKKRGNDFMNEMKKIIDEMLGHATNEQHRQEILQIFDIDILLNCKLHNLDLLQKKLLIDNFDKIYELVDVLVKENNQ
jgi:hypothetical protein